MSSKEKKIDRKQSDGSKVQTSERTQHIMKRVLYGDDWTCFYIEIT